MAHIWTHSPTGWVATALSADRFLLDAISDVVILDPVGDESLADRVVLRRFMPADAPESWLLLAPPRVGVWTNGQRVFTGLRMLRDRDEIRVRGASPIFFSTEELARVSDYPDTRHAGHCPRCRQAIVPGSPAVRCPGCHTYHHESAACNCWTYAPSCSLCAQPTALNGAYQWQPDEIGP